MKTGKYAALMVPRTLPQLRYRSKKVACIWNFPIMTLLLLLLFTWILVVFTLLFSLVIFQLPQAPFIPMFVCTYDNIAGTQAREIRSRWTQFKANWYISFPAYVQSESGNWILFRTPLDSHIDQFWSPKEFECELIGTNCRWACYITLITSS